MSHALSASWRLSASGRSRSLAWALPVDVPAECVTWDLPQLADFDGLDLASSDEAEHVGPADAEQAGGFGDRVQESIALDVMFVVSRSHCAFPSAETLVCARLTRQFSPEWPSAHLIPVGRLLGYFLCLIGRQY
jgi:hypothetical protein